MAIDVKQIGNLVQEKSEFVRALFGEIDKEKAMLNGIAPQEVVGNLTYLLKEYPIGNL